MIMDSPGDAIFQVVIEEEFALYFTIPDPADPGGARLALMRLRCFEEPKLLAATAWFGERQDLWPEWRRFAEATDGATLAGVLVKLAEEAAVKQFGTTNHLFESFEGATVTVLGDDVSISLEARLATRVLPIIRHTFKTTGHLILFLLFLDAQGRDAQCVELAQLALREGRGALARELDRIVEGVPPGRRS